MVKRSGLTVSVTDKERDRFRLLTEIEGRSYRAQLIHMVNKRLAELKKEAEE